MLVLIPTYLAGFELALALGYGPRAGSMFPEILVAMAFMFLFSIPCAVAYGSLTPTPTNLWVGPQGIILDNGAPFLRVRRTYRWEDLQLRGSFLLVPKTRPWHPRSIRLSAAQAKGLAPRFATW
jgi:hypothetical protein